MKNAFTDKVAVVTGAGSGIGRALALELGRRGARLAISDVNAAEVKTTASLLRSGGTSVHETQLDVSDRQAFIDYSDEVAAHFGAAHQIYNNAGVSGGGRYASDLDWAEYDRVIAINLFGVINGTKAFLPKLIASGDGHVINVSSANGYLAQPRLTAYCASKFGVRGFTEALRAEMMAAGHPVRVTAVHPGGVKTNIATAALEAGVANGLEVSAADRRRVKIYNEKLLKMAPEQAANIILDGVAKGSPRVRVGNDAKNADRLVRAFPAGYAKLVAALEQRIARSE